MNKKMIVLKKEIMNIIKDRKTLVIMLASPLIIPAFILIYGLLFDYMDNDEKTYTIGINYELVDTETEIFTEEGLETKYYTSIEEMEKAYDDGIITAYIYKDGDKYNAYVDSSSISGNTTSSYIYAYFEALNKYWGSNYLIGEDIDTDKVYNNVDYEIKQIKDNDYISTMIYIIASSYIIMIIISTASTISTDIIAGEKERGTLETLLTFPVKSKDIITGKYISILMACLFNTVVSIILTYGSIAITKRIFNVSFANISIINIILTSIICISCSIIVAGLCIGIASKSKSFKETQQSLSYITFLPMLSIFLELFEIKNNIFISSVPILGNTLVLNDLFYSSLEIPNLIALIVSNIIVAILIISYVSKLYKKEKILFS